MIKYQVIIIAINNKIGFIRFEPSGVLAAKSIFQVISQTIKTKASGQLVIKPVIFQTHFTFFKAERINSILNHTKNIKTIIEQAHINDVNISQPRNIAEIVKNNKVINQMIKSSPWIELNKSFFIYKNFE